ncbi:TetR/AcrR family transcriptional regulator [Pseudolabrys taiwanensis]|uniref:TetR/AcrR family transcriptional regulator n=1 Tax=Pseudolabrys taiwanensis TaxID=331696 RepID=A0A345ZY33_9HYPH|nr:TetR/AcrR family transcriptional regulator [Pseudolabrys taiwanensis]AXK81830.1 TetR/AcrR family transcriptional regulator [Pseudolabrys taiwanensis]
MRGASRVRERLRRDLKIGAIKPVRAATTVKRPRRTQASRTSEAREKLLKATLEVLVDRGYNGLTTKEVATRAGLSNGALVHHYGTKADLIMAATAFIYDRAIEKGRAIAASQKAQRDPLDAFINDCLSVYFDWPFIAATEVLVVARTDPTLMNQIERLMRHFRQTMNDIWLPVFEQSGLGRQQASFILLTTLNMIRGMAINSLWQGNMAHYKELMREWVLLVKRGALNDGRINITLRRGS